MSLIEDFICFLSSIDNPYLSNNCSSISFIDLDQSISSLSVKFCIGTNLKGLAVTSLLRFVKLCKYLGNFDLIYSTVFSTKYPYKSSFIILIIIP